jgi:hypothetical protein
MRSWEWRWHAAIAAGLAWMPGWRLGLLAAVRPTAPLAGPARDGWNMPIIG